MKFFEEGERVMPKKPVKLTAKKALQQILRLVNSQKRNGFDDDLEPYELCSDVARIAKMGLRK